MTCHASLATVRFIYSRILGIATLHLNVRNFPILGFSHQFFCTDVAKCPGFSSQLASGASYSACLQASPLTLLASRILSCPPRIDEGATSLPSTLLGGVSKIRYRQTPSSAWAWRYPIIPLAVPRLVLTCRCDCVAGQYP